MDDRIVMGMDAAGVEPFSMVVSVNYDALDLKDTITKAYDIPGRFLLGEYVKLEFIDDEHSPIREALESWQAMIAEDQREVGVAMQWLVEAVVKWPNANWRRIKRERRKFYKAYSKCEPPRIVTLSLDQTTT